MNETENYLAHHGILGMKWGYRKPRSVVSKEQAQQYRIDAQTDPGKRGTRNGLIAGFTILGVGTAVRNATFRKAAKGTTKTGAKYVESALTKGLGKVLITKIAKAGVG